jgi:hypothetical protein
MLGNLEIMCIYAWNNGVFNDQCNRQLIHLKKQCFQETIIRSSKLKGEDEEHYS